jgi:hypothetical protein
VAGKRDIAAIDLHGARQLIDEILASETWRSLSVDLKLSGREAEILACILRGLESDAIIAAVGEMRTSECRGG